MKQRKKVTDIKKNNSEHQVCGKTIELARLGVKGRRMKELLVSKNMMAGTGDGRL